MTLRDQGFRYCLSPDRTHSRWLPGRLMLPGFHDSSPNQAYPSSRSKASAK